MCFTPPGLPSDPPHRRHPGPGRDGSTNHAARPEPPSAAVGSEELRVRLPHSGESPAHPGGPLQLVLHPVPEHLGEGDYATQHALGRGAGLQLVDSFCVGLLSSLLE